MPSAGENTRSGEADVAGIARHLRARIEFVPILDSFSSTTLEALLPATHDFLQRT